MLRLEGKICLITGAAQGLGLAMAQRLVSEAETIIVCDKNYKTLEKISAEMVAKGGNVIPLKMDVSSESDWQTTSKYIEDNFGRLDMKYKSQLNNKY
jgi:NAD(P)-dependent dehydrogenase (short-subunit alcohol dehydrogenase family)